jgi:tetratricopeptide (TPR) repeat protein
MVRIFILYILLSHLAEAGNGQGYYKVALNELNSDSVNFNKVIDLFSISIKHHDQLAKSHMYRGVAETYLGKFKDAESDLDTSLTLDSVNPKIYFNIGNLFLVEGNYPKAEIYLNLSIHKDPKDPDTYGKRAICRGMLKNFTGAIEDDSKAIELDPKNCDYYADRGFSKAQLKRFTEALEDFTSSIKVEPNQKAYANRGLLYQTFKNYPQAINDYTSSLSLSPNDPFILYERGLCYMAINENKAGCLDFTNSARLGYDEAKNKLETSCK